MRAATYCRKSTAQDGNADELSVARQLTTARTFAESRGWTLDGAHAYSDNGVSGPSLRAAPGSCASWRP